MNKKNKIIIASVLALSAAGVLISGAFSFLTDTSFQEISAEVEASSKLTIAEVVPNLKINGVAADSEGEPITIAPGDISSLSWTVANAGAKAISTRNIIYIWSDDEIELDDFVYMFNDTISDDDIQAKLLDKTLETNIPLSKSEFVINSKTVTGYKYIISGDILDGVGAGAETGYAHESGFNCSIEDNSDTEDYIGIKFGVTALPSYETQNKLIKIAIVTEAMQVQNTGDSEWEIVSVKDIIAN